MKDSEIAANYHNMWWFGGSMFYIRQLKGFIAIRSLLSPEKSLFGNAFNDFREGAFMSNWQRASWWAYCQCTLPGKEKLLPWQLQMLWPILYG